MVSRDQKENGISVAHFKMEPQSSREIDQMEPFHRSDDESFDGYPYDQRKTEMYQLYIKEMNPFWKHVLAKTNNISYYKTNDISFS